MNVDRFKKISNNYSSYFIDIFRNIGLDYEDLEKSVYKIVRKVFPGYKNVNILDLGVGDGETIKYFIKSGCKKLFGVDKNKKMLARSRHRFPRQIKLIKRDIKNLKIFKKDFFPIVISGSTIHNINKKERIKVWKEILRLNPDVFVNSDKIIDVDRKKHKKDLNKEIKEVERYFQDKGLNKMAEEWIKHYAEDEKQKLTLAEMKKFLGKRYKIKVVFEMGLNKTVLAIRKL